MSPSPTCLVPRDLQVLHLEGRAAARAVAQAQARAGAGGGRGGVGERATSTGDVHSHTPGRIDSPACQRKERGTVAFRDLRAAKGRMPGHFGDYLGRASRPGRCARSWPAYELANERAAGAALACSCSSCGPGKDDACASRRAPTWRTSASARPCCCASPADLCAELLFEYGRSPPLCVPDNICERLDCLEQGRRCASSRASPSRRAASSDGLAPRGGGEPGQPLGGAARLRVRQQSSSTSWVMR